MTHKGGLPCWFLLWVEVSEVDRSNGPRDILFLLLFSNPSEEYEFPYVFPDRGYGENVQIAQCCQVSFDNRIYVLRICPGVCHPFARHTIRCTSCIVRHISGFVNYSYQNHVFSVPCSLLSGLKLHAFFISTTFISTASLRFGQKLSTT